MEANQCRKRTPFPPRGKELPLITASPPIQVSQWKKQIAGGASDLFTEGQEEQRNEEVTGQREAELISSQIGSAPDGGNWEWP